METELICDQSREKEVDTAEDLHLLDLLIILSNRRKFIGLFTLVAAVFTAITVLLLPPYYTAETLVLPPGQSSSVSSALLGQIAGSAALASVAGASLGIKNTGDLYISLFRSRTVEDSLIQRFGLVARYKCKRMSDARIAFENHSTVNLGLKDGLIRITVTDRDPKLAAEIANAYVDQLRKLSANLAVSEASQRRVFFQQQLLEANENLTAAEEAMKRTEQSTGVLQVDTQARSLIESAAVLRGQITAKEVEVQAMRTYATEGNPQMVVAEQQLSALKGQLARLSGSETNAGSDIIVPRGNIPEAGMEYIRRLRDVKYYETIEELIAKQFEMAKLDEAHQGAVIQVADEAVPPDKKSSPHRTLIVLLVTLVTFFSVTLWVFVAARWQQMLRHPDNYRKAQALRGVFFNKQR